MPLTPSVAAAWRAVQQLPPLDTHAVLVDPSHDAYWLTRRIRPVHDELRLIVEGIERGDSRDWQSVAADALETLNRLEPYDNDLGTEYMIREEVREAVIVRLDAYAGLARAIGRLGTDAAAHADTHQPALTARRPTPPALRHAMFHWDPMDMVLVPANYRSDDVDRLSSALYLICDHVYTILAAWQRGEDIDPSAAAGILESLVRCDQLLQCDDVVALGASHLTRIRRYVSTARRVADECSRLGHATHAGEAGIPARRVAHRTPVPGLPLPDAVSRAWQQLRALPPFDDYPELRDPHSVAYEVTECLREIRDELGALVWSLERSGEVDYPTRAGDVLEGLHAHHLRFERGVERDASTRSWRAYTLPADVSHAVLATASALGDLARALATVPASAPPDISALVIGTDRRSIPRAVSVAMRDWDPCDARVVHAEDFTAYRTHELEALLRRVVNDIMNTLVDIGNWKPVKGDTSARIVRLLDKCQVILDDPEVARAVKKQRRKLDRFMLLSRATAQELEKLVSDGA